ncbi:MAG TPA: hypothetical protein V6D11_08320 [Waterburya sp.]|jgi:hypothetical protein
MSSNGQRCTPSSGIVSPEAIATAMESINTLAVWLQDAGLDESAIAHWKFNALARKFPDLADIIEDAKKLISSNVPLPSVGMTATELASRLSEDLGKKIKPAQVNEALVELGLQVRPENGKRIWQLTQAGHEYGFSRLATSKTNDWSGPQVTWQESVIPLLIDYFESIEEEKSVGMETLEADGASDVPTPSDSRTLRLPESSPESKSWMVSERIKALKKKVNSSQRLHIEMEAAEAYKQRHSKLPAKEQSKDKYYDIYPASDLDLVDEAIERVLKRYTKTN